MSWLRLEEEEQIAVLLSFLVIGKETFLQICGIFKMVRDLILLFGKLSSTTNDTRLQDIPLLMPCDSGSKALCANQDT